jgi:hypothetical protein
VLAIGTAGAILSEHRLWDVANRRPIRVRIR